MEMIDMVTALQEVVRKVNESASEQTRGLDMEDQMTLCLKRAKEMWDDAFLVRGYGQSFDKYSVAPDPQALAIIAVKLFDDMEDRDGETT